MSLQKRHLGMNTLCLLGPHSPKARAAPSVQALLHVLSPSLLDVSVLQLDELCITQTDLSAMETTWQDVSGTPTETRESRMSCRSIVHR